MESRVGGISGDGAAVFADRGQDFVRYPTLELFSLLFAAAHDQLVQTRLGDDQGSTTAILPNLPIGEVGCLSDFVRVKITPKMIGLHC